MKLVTKNVYEQFVKDLINTSGVEVGDVVESVEQIIDGDGTVRAQVIYFADLNEDPQYMVDKDIAWSDTLRAAQAQIDERNAVVDAVFPTLSSVSIDD